MVYFQLESDDLWWRGVYKDCTTTDPCVEEVVAKLAKFNLESPSTNLPQPASKSLSKEVFVNHNTQMPDKRGGWYDAEIVKINAAKTKKSVIVTLDAIFPVPGSRLLSLMRL